MYSFKPVSKNTHFVFHGVEKKKLDSYYVTLFYFTVVINFHMSRVMRKGIFVYAKTKVQINCGLTAQLISAFVSATQIVQFEP